MYTHHWYLFVVAPLKNRLRLGCGFIRLSCFTPTPWSGQWFPIWKHVQWQPAVYAIEYGTVKLLPRDKTSGPGNQVTEKKRQNANTWTTKGALNKKNKQSESVPKSSRKLSYILATGCLFFRVNQPESYMGNGPWVQGPFLILCAEIWSQNLGDGATCCVSTLL